MSQESINPHQERRHIDLALQAQQSSIDALVQNFSQLPDLSSKVDVLISRMDTFSTHYLTIERTATKTTEHSTTLRILSYMVALLIPISISWNVYINQRIESLAQEVAMYQLRLDFMKEAKDEENRNKKNP